MNEIERKTTQDIKDYVKSLDRPDNEVYQQNSLLIMSCFSKAIEFIEQNAKLRQSDVSSSLPIDKNFEIVKGLLKWIKAQDIEWGDDLDVIFKPDFTDKNFTPKKRK